MTDNAYLQVVNNYDWYKDMKLLDFLRDVGKLARMGSMLNKDSVKSRLESETGMSYTEFTYQLLQGYDFVHLYRTEGIRVQIGGSDQWGNITAGTDLARKLLDAPQCFGLTFPLLVRSGAKCNGNARRASLHCHWGREDVAQCGKPHCGCEVCSPSNPCLWSKMHSRHLLCVVT
jgi:tyrosyl-tRNA synthetase